MNYLFTEGKYRVSKYDEKIVDCIILIGDENIAVAYFPPNEFSEETSISLVNKKDEYWECLEIFENYYIDIFGDHAMILDTIIKSKIVEAQKSNGTFKSLNKDLSKFPGEITARKIAVDLLKSCEDAQSDAINRLYQNE